MQTRTVEFFRFGLTAFGLDITGNQVRVTVIHHFDGELARYRLPAGLARKVARGYRFDGGLRESVMLAVGCLRPTIG